VTCNQYPFAFLNRFAGNSLRVKGDGSLHTIVKALRLWKFSVDLQSPLLNASIQCLG